MSACVFRIAFDFNIEIKIGIEQIHIRLPLLFYYFTL